MNVGEEIISRLFSALEYRDLETGAHVRRIGDMSVRLALLLDFDPVRVSAIKTAAPLHDVGKIGIPDEVLRKPGALTALEYQLMTRHTVIGSRILAKSSDTIIQMAETIAKSHHENWDGSGYPEGLKGKAIPIEARIVSIVDVYDALLSDRVYRPGMPPAKALKIICEEKGRKFDPEICTLFLDNIELFQLI